MAPAMLMGIGSVVTQPKNLVSFVVLFGMSQNLGGLIGSAILGTFQTGVKNITPVFLAINYRYWIPTSVNGLANMAPCLPVRSATAPCLVHKAPASFSQSQPCRPTYWPITIPIC